MLAMQGVAYASATDISKNVFAHIPGRDHVTNSGRLLRIDDCKVVDVRKAYNGAL